MSAFSSEFSITHAGFGRLQVRGAICFEGAAQALQAGLALIPHGERCTIDLAKVTEADSAGLAVLVEWLATARKRKSKIHYEGIPAQILAVARISDLDELLTNGH
jgi:phospholipid transport system transporter-binding protein